MTSDFTEPQWTVLDGSKAQLAALAVQAREAAGFTTAELAARKVLCLGTIQSIERGTVSPSITTLARYASALGRSLAITFLDAGNPRVPSPSPIQWRHAGDMSASSARVRALKENVAQEVLRLLESRNLTARTASALTGISQASFTRLRRGNLGPLSLEMLIEMLIRLDPERPVRLCFEPPNENP
jgi:transcriptional regulator with XRE-family HTH domain